MEATFRCSRKRWTIAVRYGSSRRATERSMIWRTDARALVSGVARAVGVDQLVAHPALPLAEARDREVACDPGEPIADPFGWVGCASEVGEPRVLGQVLGVVCVVQQARREGSQESVEL